MAGMFIGEYTFKVDSKGRTSIPALFRRELEEGDPERPNAERPRMVVVYGTEAQTHLVVYTQQAFEALARDIAALPRGSSRRKALQYLILAKSMPLEIDPDGRLVLPRDLRAKIGLDEDARFMGKGETFEIWRTETQAREEEELMAELEAEFGAGFDPLALLDEAGE